MATMSNLLVRAPRAGPQLRAPKGAQSVGDSHTLSLFVACGACAKTSSRGARWSKSFHRRNPRPCHATPSSQPVCPATERDALVRLAETQNRGIDHTPGDRAAMEAAVDALLDACPPTTTTEKENNTSHSKLSANWRLLWTSEKETLFLLKSWPGGSGNGVAVATQAYQRIDVHNKTLMNSVVFSNGNAFDVDSSIAFETETDPANGVRTFFQFTNAALKLKKPIEATLNLPPVGKGWFDTVYVDSYLRVARDSRGDTLVVCRES